MLGEQPAQFTRLQDSRKLLAGGSPVQFYIADNTAGLIEGRPGPDHRVAMHMSAPVRTTCNRSGRMERRVQMTGEIDVLAAGDHGIWIDDGPVRMLSMVVEAAYLNQVAEQSGARALLPSGPMRDPQLEEIGWALAAELESGCASGQVYSDGLALALCARLVTRFGRYRSVDQGPALTARRLRLVKEFIEANLDQPLSLAAIAGSVGSSPSHFKVLFRRAVGMPLHQYVIIRRVERARELLQSSQMPIAEVALEVGFAHQSHLARWTRRLLGVSPKELADIAGRARRAA